MSEEADLNRVQRAVDALGDFFDTVQVFVTRHTPAKGGTEHIELGAGNWYARHGQVRDWLVKDDEGTRVSVRPEQGE